jgi:GT2 family glycosyltransferase
MTAAPTIADRRDLEASLDSSSSRPRASVIVLSLNGQEYIRGCLQSLSESELRSLEIIVVNNGSTDATQEIVANEFPNVRLVNLPKNMGFAGGINEGLKRARGDVLIPLNDDTICTPGVVGRLVETLDESSDIGIVGCKILYPDKKTLQHAGGWINPNGKTHHFGYREVDEGQYDQRRDVDYVTGCMFAIRRELLERIGMLDDRYFPIYYEEVEFAVRARKNGYRVVYEPGAVLYHLESMTEVLGSPNYLYRYHKGRWRFILKNFSFVAVLKAFVLELRYMQKVDWKTEGPMLVRAHLSTIVRLPQILWDRYFRFLPIPDPS